MSPYLQQIFSLSQARIATFVAREDSRYEGSETYFREVRKEIDEAQAENKLDNQVYLEDELGDIFRDSLMLFNALASEGKISSVEKIFERCYTKFSGRVNEDGEDAGDWNEIKAKQKVALKAENTLLY
jgi:NTP pyrophosphatase (non-canonical NTP hydrolase)